MAGGVFKSNRDKIVQSIPARDKLARNWGRGQIAIGVVVINAFKDFPAPGEGDPTVESNTDAYYKWDGMAFIKISEGEDPDLSTIPVYMGASPTTVGFGYLPAGSAIAGMSLSEIFERALVEYKQSAFTSFQMVGQVLRMEVGESIPAGFINFTWEMVNNQNVKSSTLTIRDVTDNTDLFSGDAATGNAVIELTSPIRLLFPGPHTFRVTARNTRNETFQRDLAVLAEYKVFYDAGDGFSSEHIREASNQRFLSEGSTFILNTGTFLIFYVWVPFTTSVVSVIDLDELNLDITDQYRLIASSPVNDAAGSPVNGKLYLMTPLSAYSSNHRHQITIN